MSCYNFVEQYSNENGLKEKDKILKEAIDCLQEADAKRTQELYDFIDDFVKSQEYVDYIEAKKDIIKKSASTQCCENDIIVELRRESIVEKYPLTEEQKKMYAFKKQFEKYAERKSKLEMIEKQERGIAIIKKKIHEARMYWECSGEFKQRKKEKKDERLLQIYSDKLGIDLTKLSVKTRESVLERIRNNHYMQCMRKEKKRRNILNILEKLLFEEKIRKEVIRIQNKTYDYKVSRNEKIIEDMEIKGKKIELISPAKPEVKIHEVVGQNDQNEIKIEIDESVHYKRNNIEEKDRKGKKVKNEKKEKKKKNAEDKKTKKKTKEKGKKKEKDDRKLILPLIPTINPRGKITNTENLDHILDLVEEFRELDQELENRDMYQDRERKYNFADKGIRSKPDKILFQNYDEGKTYHKTIVLFNVSSQIRKIRFDKFIFQDLYDELAFEAENFGIKKLFTGCDIRFSLKFHPHDNLKSYEGKMVFLSYDVRRCEYYQTELDIRCLPRYSDLYIYPITINFGRIPIWKAQKCDCYKIIKIKNKGTKPCTIYIHKIVDPFDIGSALDDEDKENIAPEPKTSLTNLEELNFCIQNIISSCIENVDNNFHLEQSFLTLNENQEEKIRVYFKNTDYIGNYLEKFTVDVYEKFQDDSLDLVGCQEISVSAETTGHFISVNPMILDYGICQLNSCYQLNFEVVNNSNSSQAISVRFPKYTADIIQADTSTFYLSAHGKRVVWLKLLPRDYIFTESSTFFEKHTSILEFPIQIHVITRNHENCPPVKVIVYAIISNTEDITILTSPECGLSNFLDTIMLDMGSCSIYETIWTDIFLQNNTMVTQICGFIDLPQSVVLDPNCGFVKLYPNQSKKFRLYLNPIVQDFPSFTIGTLKNNKYFFKLKVDTVSHIGKIKKEINSKKLRGSMNLMLKELAKKDSQELITDMLGLMSEIKNISTQEISHSMVNKGRILYSTDGLRGDFLTTVPTDVLDNENITRSFDDTVLNYQNFVIVETTSRKEIWCKVNLKRPLLEFSHQTIEFPDTPCGSYSIMEIRLRAVDKELEFYSDLTSKRKTFSHLDFIANFRITGDSDGITIQPKCGVLTSGESTKITLLARPNVPQDIVEQSARTIKYSEIYEMKLKEYQALRAKKGKHKNDKHKKEKDKSKKKNKTKTSVNTKDSESKETKSNRTKTYSKNKPKDQDKSTSAPTYEEPNITITEKELECDYLDLFPAEMVYWRNMEPFYVKAKFTCHIDYINERKLYKKSDKIFLDAICKVIRPDFITNLNLQRLDFGKCIIGMKARKEIMIQNIKYESIKLEISILNPVGSFSIPFMRDLVIPSECTLKLPLAFTPKSSEKVTEFFEIKSNHTVLPLVLCGEGVSPNIHISPDFTIFRLEAKRNRITELHLKIENNSETTAEICFKKIFEIEGHLSDEKQKQDDGETKSAKDKKQQKRKEKKTQIKVPKSSDSLTDEELSAIMDDNCFSKVKGESHFDFNTLEDKIQIEASKIHSLTIFFGEPELLRKRKMEKSKKSKKEDKKSDYSDLSESTKSGESKKKTGESKQYITQYNIFVGKHFVKQIVLVCMSQ